MAISRAPHSSKSLAAHTAAESIAIECLTFLASDPERLERFLALFGLGPDNLREAASAPGFLVAVLDHVAADESLLLAFAAQIGADPSAIERARQTLGGPDPADMV